MNEKIQEIVSKIESYVEYSTEFYVIEDLIKEYFGIPEYNILNLERTENVYLKYMIEPYKYGSSSYFDNHIAMCIKGTPQIGGTETILRHLCHNGIIPPGRYKINVDWC